MQPNTIFIIRAAVIAVSAIFTGLVYLFDPNESLFEDFPAEVVWIIGGFILLSILLFPFMVATVISFLAINALSDQTWTRPDHFSNPLNFRNPLLFPHFGAFAIMASGAGIVSTSFVGGFPQFLYGVCVILGGGACLAGVHLAMRWCKTKMPDHSCKTLRLLYIRQRDLGIGAIQFQREIRGICSYGNIDRRPFRRELFFRQGERIYA
ncbi:MAG: hypothetical protein JJU05_00965 [Verrucomicrobia bacterium]|nr:hypothetical protein [Verrucomicrobiota bacterium]MCH8525945.1 hypothetical protein [Kiritimatiellia bacterium]